MALAVITRPMPRAMMAWYVRRLCNRVSDHMAHGAMTPAEPPVQQASSGLTKGDESSTLPVMVGLPPACTRHIPWCTTQSDSRMVSRVTSGCRLTHSVSSRHPFLVHIHTLCYYLQIVCSICPLERGIQFHAAPLQASWHSDGRQ